MKKTATGTVHQINERNCGLIRRVGVKDHLFFHADAVIGISFTALKKGTKVQFEVIESSKGPYAIEVRKV